MIRSLLLLTLTFPVVAAKFLLLACVLEENIPDFFKVDIYSAGPHMMTGPHPSFQMIANITDLGCLVYGMQPSDSGVAAVGIHVETSSFSGCALYTTDMGRTWTKILTFPNETVTDFVWVPKVGYIAGTANLHGGGAIYVVQPGSPPKVRQIWKSQFVFPISMAFGNNVVSVAIVTGPAAPKIVSGIVAFDPMSGPKFTMGTQSLGVVGGRNPVQFVTFSNGIFLATGLTEGMDQSLLAYVSKDGLTWKQTSTRVCGDLDAGPTPMTGAGSVIGNSKFSFIVSCVSQVNNSLTSNDGSSWTLSKGFPPAYTKPGSIVQFAAAGPMMMMAGGHPDEEPQIWGTVDGQKWLELF